MTTTLWCYGQACYASVAGSSADPMWQLGRNGAWILTIKKAASTHYMFLCISDNNFPDNHLSEGLILDWMPGDECVVFSFWYLLVQGSQS